MGNYFKNNLKITDKDNSKLENNTTQNAIISRGNLEEVELYPEHDNLTFEKHFRTEKEIINFHNSLNILNQLQKFDVDETIFSSFEIQREESQYFKIENIIEDYNAREIFVKVLDFNEKRKNDKEKFYMIFKKNKRIIKEYKIINSLRHRSIPQVLGYFADTLHQRIYLMYENHDITLHNLIFENKLGSFINKIRILKNLIEAILYYHLNGVLSFDLSCETIGISKKTNSLKILTFGNSINLTEKKDYFYENWFNRFSFSIFTSPELYLNRPIMSKCAWGSDIWSLGIICSIIFQNNYKDFYMEIFKEFDKNEKMIYSEKEKFNKKFLLKCLFFENIENPLIKAFIISLINEDPLLRPNIFQVVDYYNKIISFLKLDSEYFISYNKNDVFSFLSVFDNPLLELIYANNRNEKEDH